MLCCLLTSKDFHPVNTALTVVGFLHCFIHHAHHDRRNINTRAIALDEGNDWMKRHIQCLVSIDRDFLTLCWNLNMLVHEANLR